jgi:hypothetical protein
MKESGRLAQGDVDADLETTELSQGLAQAVKTIYYPSCRSQEPNHFVEPGHIVNSRLVTVNAKPATGFCALVPAASMWGGLQQLRHESDDRMHPGECRA